RVFDAAFEQRPVDAQRVIRQLQKPRVLAIEIRPFLIGGGHPACTTSIEPPRRPLKACHPRCAENPGTVADEAAAADSSSERRARSQGIARVGGRGLELRLLGRVPLRYPAPRRCSPRSTRPEG